MRGFAATVQLCPGNRAGHLRKRGKMQKDTAKLQGAAAENEKGHMA